MAILIGSALALLLQAHSPQNDFDTDVEAVTADCIAAHREALESDTVSTAQWKDFIACVFASTAKQMDLQLPKKIDPMTTLVAVSWITTRT